MNVRARMSAGGGSRVNIVYKLRKKYTVGGWFVIFFLLPSLVCPVGVHHVTLCN